MNDSELEPWEFEPEPWENKSLSLGNLENFCEAGITGYYLVGMEKSMPGDVIPRKPRNEKVLQLRLNDGSESLAERKTTKTTKTLASVRG